MLEFSQKLERMSELLALLVYIPDSTGHYVPVVHIVS